MKGVLLFGSGHHERKSAFITFIKKIILVPAKSGLYGFAAFFTVLIFLKGIINILGITDYYAVNSDDVLFSSLGFIIGYFGKLVKDIILRTKS